MVRSDLASSGVIFSLDTESGFDKVVYLTGAWGLGENIVQGNVNPDEVRRRRAAKTKQDIFSLYASFSHHCGNFIACRSPFLSSGMSSSLQWKRQTASPSSSANWARSRLVTVSKAPWAVFGLYRPSTSRYRFHAHSVVSHGLQQRGWQDRQEHSHSQRRSFALLPFGRRSHDSGQVGLRGACELRRNGVNHVALLTHSICHFSLCLSRLKTTIPRSAANTRPWTLSGPSAARPTSCLSSRCVISFGT